MAHKLIPLNQNIKIHQALHGYVDGHREVAASCKLIPHDSKTMLILSDISNSGACVAEEGYLTGYPLTESGYYALAKTWPAPEMTRPGCVWTHTLLIDFADLANLSSAQDLLTLFRRPNLGELSGYSSHLTIGITPDDDLDCKSELIDLNLSEWLKQLLLGLYERPKKSVFATYSSDCNYVPVVLALWFQQWPRLRRAFCFCTSTTTDRSSSRVTFDLQLVPKEIGLRGQFHDITDVADVPKATDSWVEHAYEDIVSPRQNSLHKFFRRVGGDVASGRLAFTELTRLHKLIECSEGQPTVFDEIIILLNSESILSSVKAVRKVVVSRAAYQANKLSSRALDFLVRNIFLIDDEARLTQSKNIGHAIWKNNPVAFAGLLNNDKSGEMIAISTLASLSNIELIEGLQDTTELDVPILTRRPEIMVEPSFWECDVKLREAAFGVLKKYPNMWPAAIGAMITSGAGSVVKPAFNCFGFETVWNVLAQALDDSKKVKPCGLLQWLECAMKNKEAVAKVLADSRVRMRHSLVTIARMTTPSRIPNNYGKDPWLLAIQGVEGELDDSDEIYFMSYLLSRALGSTSKSVADLVAISFDLVYRSALTDSISDDAWNLLNKRLPDASWWDSWDRCRRLRQAVAELFLNRNLSATVFGQLTQDDIVFAEIASTERGLHKGKHYLKKVRKALSSDDLQQYPERIHVIDKLLDR